MGNCGFRRYLRKAWAEAREEGDPEVEPDAQEELPETGAVLQVDEAKIADEAQFDGVSALRTNTSLPGGRSGPIAQAVMAGGAELADGEVAAADAAGVPPSGRDDPRARVLLVSGAGAEEGVGEASAGGGD